jgi:hypothetical protein
MKGASVLYSHRSNEHITPPEIIDRLETTFKIAYDPCPSPNYLHRQFEKENNGVSNGPYWPKVPIFINPPYSDIENWVDSAISQFKKSPENPIILLLPVRTDRPWFEKLFNVAHAIGFIRGRLRFRIADPQNKGIIINSKWQAPFPSMIVVLETNVSVSRNADILTCLGDLNCVSLVLKEVDNNLVVNR